ncbi:2'-O-methyl transferase [Listeria monocytogenes]|uniref:2'-O-methyl transferase n=2 Tax=Listeria monocytogenes TaxID=1639 RepID=UPI00074D6C3C|nr:2'-O-methyl transferase [Listeria monocytogenes]EAD0235282.1 2'-O-methyl transferase [Listeria monocytogenes]EAE7905371.1 2'-O-methyl transferase [Listeria monocytogenes]EAE7908968.1 2'-O-methyl transferase [Listeria monocytogenes]EAE7924125.1 2'-O-methyl transferase [Listeria monocytogenes]EAF3600751.1 2'-O-methyl transferase [Listeria monocytogenes]
MKRYIINRGIMVAVVIIYMYPLLGIIKGKKIFGDIGTPIVMIIAALIGTLSSVFLSEEKTKREYEKEKLEKDERYINNRKTFSHYLLIVLALTIPIVLIVLNLNGIEQISISSLTIIFLIFCFAYMIVLEIIRKKV